MNKSILYLAACGIAALGAAYMSHSYQAERSEELVRNAKYKAIPNGLQAMMQMQRPTISYAKPDAKRDAKSDAKLDSKLNAKPVTARKKGTTDQQKHAHAPTPDLESARASH